MRTSMLMLLVLILAGAVCAGSPSPAPSSALKAPAADASDVAALDAYLRDRKNPEALFDYFFSLLKLDRFKDARRVLGEWRTHAPTDPRHGDVGGLLDALEKEPDPRQRERIGTDWAVKQQRAAREQFDEIRSNMQKMGEGLAGLDAEQARRGASSLPRLKAQLATAPTAENWLAYSDALVATGDYRAALAAAQEAVKKDARHTLAAISVTHLSRFDGKNGDEIKRALQKERVNQVLKKIGP